MRCGRYPFRGWRPPEVVPIVEGMRWARGLLSSVVVVLAVVAALGAARDAPGAAAEPVRDLLLLAVRWVG